MIISPILAILTGSNVATALGITAQSSSTRFGIVQEADRGRT